MLILNEFPKLPKTAKIKLDWQNFAKYGCLMLINLNLIMEAQKDFMF